VPKTARNQKRRPKPRRAQRRRDNPYARWRVASLLAVHVLFVAHIVHWKLAGRTLAPLELNEVMYTLELGIITAGFVFMVVAVLATSVFGRFFCSWGCHILALQDLSAWLLGKIGIKPRPIRSRLLLWVPLVAAGYMFVWPQLHRFIMGAPKASLRVATDTDGWASFVTENFWRNLPGPGVAIATFLTCGFLIVYVLGTRSFCAYGCPYGAVFGLADRLAPGRIRVGPDCTQCATCTSVCNSNVRVHEELARYGMVVNPACLKDLDCVGACPQRTLHYGFGRPSLLRRMVGTKTVTKRYTFTPVEEMVAGYVFLAALLIYRGLYDALPFLMSLAVAAILAYGFVVAIRLVTRPDVLFNGWTLRSCGALTRRGIVFAVGAVCLAALTLHSAAIRLSAFQGERLYHEALAPDADAGRAEGALAHLSRAQAWGIVATPSVERIIGDLYTHQKRWADAEASRRRSLALSPGDPAMHERLGRVLHERGRTDAARRHLAYALRAAPNRPELHYALAGIDFKAAKPDSAVHHLREALRIRPDFAEAHYELGAILVELGAVDEAIDHLRACIRLKPDHGDARYNLAVALATRGQVDDAMDAIDRALAIQPNDVQTQQFRAVLGQLKAGQTSSSASAPPNDTRNRHTGSTPGSID